MTREYHKQNWTEAQPIPIEGIEPPYDLNSEALVIEACLAVEGFIERVHPPLTHEHFYSSTNRTVFEAITELNASGTQIDAISVLDWLKAKEYNVTAIDSSILTPRSEFTENDISQAVSAARIVFELAQQRSLALHCQQAVTAIYMRSLGSHKKFFDEFESKSSALCHVAVRDREVVSAEQAANEALEEILNMKKDLGVRTGLRNYDRVFGLLKPGEYTIIGAASGGAKSSFGLTLANQIALDGNGVLYCCTADLDRRELMFRSCCSLGDVSPRRILDGIANTDEYNRLIEARRRFEGLPFLIDDLHESTVERIESQTKKASAVFKKKKAKFGLVVVDYLQACRKLGTTKNTNREQELRNISDRLKDMAKTNNVHVLALVQTWNPKDDGRPSADQIKDCKSVIQSASNFGIIVRHKNDQGKYDTICRSTIYVDKIRWRPQEDVHLLFNGGFVRFENDAEYDHD